MKATCDVTAKFCRHRRILWVSEQLCSVSRLILGILHFYYAFLIYKYTMYNIPEMTWVPITSTLSKFALCENLVLNSLNILFLCSCRSKGAEEIIRQRCQWELLFSRVCLPLR